MFMELASAGFNQDLSGCHGIYSHRTVHNTEAKGRETGSEYIQGQLLENLLRQYIMWEYGPITRNV